MEELTFETSKKFELVDITPRVQELVKNSGVEEGLCCLYVPHSTAAIIINESYDPKIKDDVIDLLNKLVPEHGSYRHDRIDNNAQAHLKAAILPTNQIIPVHDNKLLLGTWQNILLCELDGPKQRRVIVTVK